MACIGCLLLAILVKVIVYVGVYRRVCVCVYIRVCVSVYVCVWVKAGYPNDNLSQALSTTFGSVGYVLLVVSFALEMSGFGIFWWVSRMSHACQKMESADLTLLFDHETVQTWSAIDVGGIGHGNWWWWWIAIASYTLLFVFGGASALLAHRESLKESASPEGTAEESQPIRDEVMN